MADVENRRDYRGGGRGYNNQKRKRNRDDDDADGYRNMRPRQEAPPGTRIRRGLLEIAEDPLRLPHEVAANVGKLAADNWEDEYVRDTFSGVALKLVVEQPFKIPFVAGVVLYANADNGEIAKDIISQAAPLLQEYLGAGQWREFKLMLRFFACMSQLYEEDGIIPILDELFNRAVDLQTASPDDAVGIELVKIILVTIPYLLAATEDASLQQMASEVLEKTDIVASTPHPIEALVDPYPNTTEQDGKPMACTSVISLMQRQLQEEASNGWQLKCIPRVYDPNHKASAANGDGADETDGEPKEFVKHAFPTITVPSPVNTGTKPLFPEIYFSLYADQEIESVPPTSNIASSLLRDAILDTVNILDFNRNVTARFLNEIDCYWSPGTFVKRATTFDKLRDMSTDKPTWKPEDVAIDAIFSQIYQLPTPEHRLVYYHSLITESCKISPQAIAPSLGRAIRFLFRNVDTMDMELTYRFMDWFGHHLSNFEFRWKWAEWIPELDLSNLHPKKAFIIGTLDKEIQLSFAKRVRDTLPQEYHPLIPQSKENEVPPFKYNDEATSFAKEGREILQMLKKKAPEEDVQNVLNAVHEQAANHGIDPLVASTDIYMTAICSVGSKSLSHVLSTIDRCKERLLAVGSQSEPARRQIISSVVGFWADHPGTAVNIVDKLLNYTIVTPMSVILWALQDHMDRGRALANSQIYELISITMFKVTNRVRQVLRERNNPALPFYQRQQIDEALPRERQGMRDLFAAIEDAVAGVAQGAQDEMIERYDGEEVEQQLIQLWGARWARVWRRKAAVEEAVVGDAVVQPLVEPVEAVEDTVEEVAPVDALGSEDMDQI
ncbi:hypothetical protein LTR36_009424 [Oleoguttula mirabilis]|uniref:Cap binding protein n=1 Tax=Oleoguttula mirabilis TaxID=1507867 RepID=A0AAV9JTB0_9PEZI|nr:hypothetical protein LTR36_009424 [Oleoguttula mirabilis]